MAVNILALPHSSALIVTYFACSGHVCVIHYIDSIGVFGKARRVPVQANKNAYFGQV